MLDIRKEVTDLQTMYSQTQTERHSFLVIGPTGSGKTRLLETCVRPIHVDSFDPRGTETLSRAIREGYVVADTRFESEDPTDPSVFELWDLEYARRKKEGYFNYFGTYALDSFTTFSDAVMNYLLYGAPKGGSKRSGFDGRKADRSDLKTNYLAIPQENDYPIQMAILYNVVKDLMTLPCDVVLIGHTEDKKDKSGNVLGKGLYSTGKLAIRIPRLFEEVYIAKTKDSSEGPTFWLQTKPEGMLEAKTRLGREVFDFYEKPDILYLLKKAGKNPQHKPIVWKEEN